MPSSPPDAPLGEQLKQSSGSYELVLSVAILAFGGLWLDRRLGTTPWLTVLSTILGFIGAVASQYYRYKDRIARLQAETAELRARAETARPSGGDRRAKTSGTDAR